VTIEARPAGFDVAADCAASPFKMTMITAVASTLGEATELLGEHLLDPPASFSAACSDSTDRWADAFTPSNSFYSGNLPTLESDSPSLDALFTWAATAQQSLMRTSMESFPRQYVISEGASNSYVRAANGLKVLLHMLPLTLLLRSRRYSGESGMGGAGQFIWDLSFSATTLALLDPEVARAITVHLVANAEFGQRPIAVPQAWDAFPAYPNLVGGGQ
jgi:hypothetical protein